MKTSYERIDPQLAEALAALPKLASGVFDVNDIAGTRAASHKMADAANTTAAADGYTAYRWLLKEAATLGIDERRIGIAGASRGGIAAASMLMTRDMVLRSCSSWLKTIPCWTTAMRQLRAMR